MSQASSRPWSMMPMRGAQGLHLFHVMAGVDDGHAGGVEPAHFLEDVIARLRIDADGRLVEQQQPRLMHQGHAQVEPAFHAAGEGPARSSARSARPMAARISSTRSARIRARQAVEFAEEEQVLAGGQLVVDGQFLRHDADQPAHLAVAGPRLAGPAAAPRRRSPPADRRGWTAAWSCRRRWDRAGRTSRLRRPGS